MLKNILAVITASVSLASCETSPTNTSAGRESHIVKRPITHRDSDGSPLSDQAGSTATTVAIRTDAGHGGPTAAASATGSPSPGTSVSVVSPDSSSLNS